MEQEEGRVARATVREDTAYMKELRAVEQAELHTRRHAQRDESRHLCTKQAALAAAKAAKKARKAAQQ